MSQDAAEALVHADTIAVICEGEILQTGAPAAVYRAPKALQVAEAQGPVHSDSKSALPPLWYRPEAIQVGTGEPMTITDQRLAGPITEIALKLTETDVLLAACQPGTPLAPGDQVGVTLNPDLVFDFAAEPI